MNKLGRYRFYRLPFIATVFFLLTSLLSINCGGGGGDTSQTPPAPVPSTSLDSDSDGFTTEAGDCDDTKNDIHPGATEICGDSVDQDCNNADLDCKDVDNDGDGFTETQEDCDDTKSDIHPNATDICGDGVDQDCNNADLDCKDVDNDGDGFTETQEDCDDTKSDIHPNATDICGDGVDQDCNGADLICDTTDNDNDGFAENQGDCDDTKNDIHPGATEICGDGIDQDCNNADLVCENKDTDSDGFTDSTGDCNDTRGDIYPGATEICGDGVDQDCNNMDLDCKDVDSDKDTFSPNQGDCDDTDPLKYPNAVDIPGDNIDHDCDGFGTTANEPISTVPDVSAELDTPDSVAFDSSGSLYIADLYYSRVLKIDVHGVITTVAGNGINGYSGDGGAATNAQLYNPRGLAIDTADNLYIADTNNQCIRKVDGKGIITTIAGNGTAGYSGDNDLATKAMLYFPSGVAIGSSGLYIADTLNSRIRKVDNRGIITTVAGNGTEGYAGDNDSATKAKLNRPSGIAYDNNGNLYIADTNNQRIRRVDARGIISTVAGTGNKGYSGDNGAATAAQLSSPYNVALDSVGNLYISDFSNQRIRKLTLSTGVITTVAGDGTNGYSGDNGAATEAQISNPTGITIDSAGNLYIADTLNSSIRKVDS